MIDTFWRGGCFILAIMGGIGLVILAIMLTGCGDVITPTATAVPSETPVNVTDTPTPEPATVTLAPSLTPTITQTSAPGEYVYFFDNAGFEEGCSNVEPYGLPEICVPTGWTFNWCDSWWWEYTLGISIDCPAPYINYSPATGESAVGLGNPSDLIMRRPEAAPHTVANWVSEGSHSFRWFFMFGTGEGWLGQTHDLPAGIYYVGVDVGAWQNSDDDAASDFPNADAVYGANFEIIVDPYGRHDHTEREDVYRAVFQVTDPYDTYTYYDKMQQIVVGPIEHPGGPLSVWLGGFSNFPISNPDRYADWFYMVQAPIDWIPPEGWFQHVELDIVPTPTPIATAVPQTPTPTAIPVPPIDQATYTPVIAVWVNNSAWVRYRQCEVFTDAIRGDPLADTYNELSPNASQIDNACVAWRTYDGVSYSWPSAGAYAGTMVDLSGIFTDDLGNVWGMIAQGETDLLAPVEIVAIEYNNVRMGWIAYDRSMTGRFGYPAPDSIPSAFTVSAPDGWQ